MEPWIKEWCGRATRVIGEEATHGRSHVLTMRRDTEPPREMLLPYVHTARRTLVKGKHAKLLQRRAAKLKSLRWSFEVVTEVREILLIKRDSLQIELDGAQAERAAEEAEHDALRVELERA
ncbi:hypothetical protein AMTR_s00060p00189330 [Amborella trichopoda]|uniref:Uncharacterized protein n=1 Tax=Amborella trichopoda TaxID=13333 RepID=W1NL32_AMBTC|nr:hypothetical protein AMTR_s00060p00189330 [Amborella trichopoda]